MRRKSDRRAYIKTVENASVTVRFNTRAPTCLIGIRLFIHNPKRWGPVQLMTQNPSPITKKRRLLIIISAY